MSSPLAADAADIISDVQGSPVSGPSVQEAYMKWSNTDKPPGQGGNATPWAAPQGERDSAGEVYDPSVHSAKRSKTADGRWRRRRGAGAAPRRERQTEHASPSMQATVAGQSTPISVAGQPDTFRADPAPEIRPLAQATVATFTGCLAMVGGPGWLAGASETEAMVNAWEAYYRAKNIRDVPPGLMVAAVMGTYVGTRIIQPQNTAPLVALYERFMQRNIPNARPHTGSNRAGQIHVAPTAQPPIPEGGSPNPSLYDSPERIG